MFDYVKIIALDRADEKVDVCVRQGDTCRFETVSTRPEALHRWWQQECPEVGETEVAVVFEQPAENLLAFFCGKRRVVIYALNPLAVARYRQAFSTSGAKSDGGDCAIMADLIAYHAQRFAPMPTTSAELQRLGELVESRRGLVNQRVSLTNQLRSSLKKTYPHALELIGVELWRPMATRFLRRWSTMSQLKTARAQTLRRFYHAHGSRSETLIEERLAVVAAAQPLTTQSSLIEPAALLVTNLAKMIETVVAAIRQFDRQIATVFPECPDAALFAGLPGAGTVIAPRLLCAFGSDRQRFTNVVQIQRYSGIAPVTRQSGKTRIVERRWRCPKFLRQSFHEFAGSSLAYSRWAKTYYQAQRQRGKSHQIAVRALAYKWQRVMFACWKNRVAYDEQRHCKDLMDHGSPHFPNPFASELKKSQTIP